MNLKQHFEARDREFEDNFNEVESAPEVTDRGIVVTQNLKPELKKFLHEERKQLLEWVLGSLPVNIDSGWNIKNRCKVCTSGSMSCFCDGFNQALSEVKSKLENAIRDL